MRIYISHLLPDGEMAELISRYHTGVESIEFSISENLDHNREKIREYRRKLETWGNPPLILHGPFLDLNPAAYDSKIKQVTADRFEQAFEAAVELGAEKVIYHSGFIPGIYYLQGWAERAADFWNKFLDGKKEIRVLLENVYDPEPEVFAEAGRQIPHGNFGFCLDMGHAHCYSKKDIHTWIHMLGERIYHVHVHDNCKDQDSHLALGKGTIPFPAALEQMRIISPHAAYTIECSTREDAGITCQVIQDLIH